ncbi:hypothetical protein LTR85_002537 [Meristemomyces frigidus]|nr:hypothetical protein LTR85_002537 [Meristemomyces frigidus]
MGKTVRQFPVPPITILDDLATIHCLLKRPALRSSDYGPALIASFCSMIWGWDNWHEAITAAQARPLPEGDYHHTMAYDRQREVVEQLKHVDEELADIFARCWREQV